VKLSIERTDRLVSFQGQTVRVWQGTTETGAPVDVMVANLVGPGDEADRDQFEAGLADEGVPFIPICVRQRAYRQAKKETKH
jgi:hypothetical protein